VAGQRCFTVFRNCCTISYAVDPLNSHLQLMVFYMAGFTQLAKAHLAQT